MPDLKLAEALAEPMKPPILDAKTPRRWHTVIIQAPLGTVSHKRVDKDGILCIDFYAAGEQVGQQREVQEITTWSERGPED